MVSTVSRLSAIADRAAAPARSVESSTPHFPLHPLSTKQRHDVVSRRDLHPATDAVWSDSMSSLKRKRSRQACGPCRERKRRCDGNEPCLTCTDWGYSCYYEPELRHRASRPAAQAVPGPSSVVSPPVQTSAPEQPSTVGSDHSGLVRRLEANSGAAFVRNLGLKIDPTKAPKLNLFGWNIGTRQLSSQMDFTTSPLPVVEITSLEHMKFLAKVYFDKVDPCYGFIDQEHFFAKLTARWESPQTSGIYDSVLGGVAAIGCLFSQRNATITELHLVRSARACLDSYHLSGPPPIDLLTGWTLRVCYLRMTDSPHSTWIASSTLMHLVEASGLHPGSPSVLLPSAQCDPDIQRRLVGVAHHLNAWTSFDLGLSRVSFRTDELPLPPEPKPGDYTAEVLGLLPVSVSLDPGRLKQETDLTSTLSDVVGGIHTRPPSVLAQCNLVLCILRRIHTQNLDISPGLAEQVLALLKKGLGCARKMVTECCPWHQVANVPFHVLCFLLVMDTRSSLAMLPEAMQTLSLVASTYDTEAMREAHSAACLLILLHQQRRKDDIAILGEALNIHHQERQAAVPPQQQISPSAEDYSWLGALVADLPGLQRIDFDQFLHADLMSGPSFMGGSG